MQAAQQLLNAGTERTLVLQNRAQCSAPEFSAVSVEAACYHWPARPPKANSNISTGNKSYGHEQEMQLPATAFNGFPIDKLTVDLRLTATGIARKCASLWRLWECFQYTMVKVATGGS